MRQMLGEVTANIALGPTTHVLRVRAAEIALSATPGQFVHVRCTDRWDPLLRRPLSIARVWDNGEAGHAEEFALLVEVVGRGSAVLAACRTGDQLDLLGPLGRGFALHPKARQILLVAGGVGIAPLLALAEEALAHDLSVTLLFGARTGAKVFPPALVPPAVEYVVLTEDGSLGRRGLVTEALPEYLPWADQLFTCGPEPMLCAIARALYRQSWGLPSVSPSLAQVSLERHMGCAMGACYGCVVDTASGRERVCRDGPVFDLFEVKW